MPNKLRLIADHFTGAKERPASCCILPGQRAIANGRGQGVSGLITFAPDPHHWSAGSRARAPLSSCHLESSGQCLLAQSLAGAIDSIRVRSPGRRNQNPVAWVRVGIEDEPLVPGSVTPFAEPK